MLLFDSRCIGNSSMTLTSSQPSCKVVSVSATQAHMHLILTSTKFSVCSTSSRMRFALARTLLSQPNCILSISSDMTSSSFESRIAG